MNFMLRPLGLAIVLGTVANYCHAEVLGTFEGRVIRYYERDLSMPATIPIGALVVGCFRYWPEEVYSVWGPSRDGGVTYYFHGLPPASVLAMSIGDLVWRSGEELRIPIKNNKKMPFDPAGRFGDMMILSYGRSDLKVPPKHPGVPPDGLGSAGIKFEALGSPPDFLKSTELPGSLGDLDFTSVDQARGRIGASNKKDARWGLQFTIDLKSLMINGRPVIPGAKPPESAGRAGGLCSRALVSTAPGAGAARNSRLAIALENP